MVRTKKCAKCQKFKPASEFWKAVKNPTGLQGYCKACAKARGKTYKPAGHRRREYGLSEEEYQYLLLKQAGRCRICRAKTKLVVDHCHDTERVRGLLCNRCNMGLGALRDNVALLKRAIRYLEEA